MDATLSIHSAENPYSLRDLASLLSIGLDQSIDTAVRANAIDQITERLLLHDSNSQSVPHAESGSLDEWVVPFLVYDADGPLAPSAPNAIDIESAYRQGCMAGAEIFSADPLLDGMKLVEYLDARRHVARVAAIALDEQYRKLDWLKAKAFTRGQHQTATLIVESLNILEARGLDQLSDSPHEADPTRPNEQYQATASHTLEDYHERLEAWSKESLTENDPYFSYPPLPFYAIDAWEEMEQTQAAVSHLQRKEPCRDSDSEDSLAMKIYETIQADAGESDNRFTLDSLPEESACEVAVAVRDFAQSRYPGSALAELMTYCDRRRWTSYQAPCLATALGTLSALASWNYRSASADPNLYIVLTGDTSTGKNMPIEVVPEILRRCGAHDRIAGKPSSFQMFNSAFENNSAPCLVWDEIGAGVQSRDKAFQLGFTETINSLYTSARDRAAAMPTAKKDGAERKTAVYPHPTIVGSSTPTEIVNAFGSAGSSGLLTRLINLHMRPADERPISRERRRELTTQGTPKIPESLISACRKILNNRGEEVLEEELEVRLSDCDRRYPHDCIDWEVDGKPRLNLNSWYLDPASVKYRKAARDGRNVIIKDTIDPGGYENHGVFAGIEIGQSDEVTDYMLDIGEEVDLAKVTSTDRREILARFSQNVAKVSLLIAVGVHASEITLEMVKLAVRIVSASCLASGSNFVLAGDSEAERARGRVIKRVLDARAKGVRWRDLKKGASKDPTIRRKVMDSLLDSSELRYFTVKTGSGRAMGMGVHQTYASEFFENNPGCTISSSGFSE